jgi:hypothetical protein
MSFEKWPTETEGKWEGSIDVSSVGGYRRAGSDFEK